jgi:hypothetical protein
MRQKIFWLAIVMVLICACAISPGQVDQQPTQPPVIIPTQLEREQPTESCPASPTCPSPATEVPTTIPTPIPTNTPVLVNSPTPVPRAYKVQPNTPTYLQNFAHPDKACNWLGVAGQVFDKSGNPVQNLVVGVVGELSGNHVDQLGMTGAARAYGPGGYELVIADKAVDSTGSLNAQLFDLDGTPLSDPFSFNTAADCKKNLILINFIAQ